MNNQIRPAYCFDNTCTILWKNYDQEYHDKGYSYFCFGKLKTPHRFVEKECEHINNYCHCIYTPLKGALRFYISQDDAWIYQLGACHILNNAEPLFCDECGFIDRVANTVIYYSNGDKLCPLCSLRLGKKKWDKETKKYILIEGE